MTRKTEWKDLRTLFEEYRHGEAPGIGLAWYIAAEIGRRYYVSHGIWTVPFEHEGLGYYGIMFWQVPCRIHKKRHGERGFHLGRMTINGDVENWVTGLPGDHGLDLINRCYRDKEDIDSLLLAAIEHMRLPAKPETSHVGCRHQRWGRSYTLLFDLVTRMVLENKQADIVMEPDLVERIARKHDPDFGRRENPGYMRLWNSTREVLLCGDGRVLMPEREESLWEQYMLGASEENLYHRLLGLLGMDG